MITQDNGNSLMVLVYSGVYQKEEILGTEPNCQSSHEIRKLLPFQPSWIPWFHYKPVKGRCWGISICCSQVLHDTLFNFPPISVLTMQFTDHRQVLQLLPLTADSKPQRRTLSSWRQCWLLDKNSLDNADNEYLPPLITCFLQGQVHKRL